MPKICAYFLREKNTNVPVVENAIVHNILNEENSMYSVSIAICGYKREWKDLSQSLTLTNFR